MKPEELVARHLEALGSREARAATDSRSAEGATTLRLLIGGSGSLVGPTSFVSQGRKVLLSIRFNHIQYPAEELSFDGDKVYVTDLQPGLRSQLGQFLYQYDRLITEGLLGGVLSTAWPLLDVEAKRPRLKYRGLKKINDRHLLELQYRMRKGGADVNIRLYFEPETFRHLATIYRLTISAFMGRTPQESARQSETRYKLEEWFDDFRTMDGLDLPSHWTIRLTIEGGRGSYMAEWDTVYNQITHNLSIDPQRFVLH
ncbi:hypothetical protein MYX84_15725 [Acidobacteria bacterium AH-259-O06]|nr:hypothetical protein [Acidobacteria bacterium AH-259-O06]